MLGKASTEEGTLSGTMGDVVLGYLSMDGCEIVGRRRQKLSVASLQLFSLRGKVGA